MTKGTAGSAGYIHPDAVFERPRKRTARPVPEMFRATVAKSQARRTAKLIAKLEQVTEARGASPAEALYAAAMLCKLRDGPQRKFDLIKKYGALLRHAGLNPNEMSCADIEQAIHLRASD